MGGHLQGAVHMAAARHTAHCAEKVFNASRKGGTGGSGWCHLQGAVHMAGAVIGQSHPGRCAHGRCRHGFERMVSPRALCTWQMAVKCSWLAQVAM